MKRSVCYYCVATHLGGAEKSLLEFLGRVGGDERLVVRVLAPRSTGPLVAALRSRGTVVDCIPMPDRFFRLSRSTPLRSIANLICSLPALARYVSRVRKYLRETGAEVVHTTGIKCHLLSWPATIGLGIPVLWHLRDILARGPTWLALRALGRGHVRLIANSEATAISFSRRRRPRVIHNGIDLAAYRPGGHAHRKLPVVGIVGALARWKGQAEFLRMAALLGQRGIAAHYMVIGDQIYDTTGDRGYAAELRTLASSLGLESVVSFTGFREDITTALGGIDILVHASVRPEPFGRVLIEAQACGVAVVASAAGGVPEIVADEITGLLFRPAQVHEMADQVARLIHDPALRARLARNGREAVAQRFSLDSHVSQIMAVYGELGRHA